MLLTIDIGNTTVAVGGFLGPELRFVRPVKADLPLLKEGMLYGVPPMLQSSIGAAGSLFLQRFMNSFGTDTVTAITTAYRVDTIILLPIINLGSAISTLTAHSHGAGDDARARRILYAGAVLMTGVSLLLTGIIIPTGGWLISIFGAGETVVGIGEDFFGGIAPFYVVYGLALAVRGSLEGFGDLIYSSAVSVAALAVRIGASYAMKPVFEALTIAYAEALSWALMLALYALRFIVKRRK